MPNRAPGRSFFTPFLKFLELMGQSTHLIIKSSPPLKRPHTSDSCNQDSDNHYGNSQPMSRASDFNLRIVESVNFDRDRDWAHIHHTAEDRRIWLGKWALGGVELHENIVLNIIFFLRRWLAIELRCILVKVDDLNFVLVDTQKIEVSPFLHIWDLDQIFSLQELKSEKWLLIFHIFDELLIDRIVLDP